MGIKSLKTQTETTQPVNFQLNYAAFTILERIYSNLTRTLQQVDLG